MHGAAGVSDVNRNCFLARPVSKKEMEENSHGLFHDLPEELQVSAIMMCMEDAPDTIKANEDSLLEQRKMRLIKEELAKKKGLEKASDVYITRLVFHAMWDSDACMKTVGEVTEKLKKMKTKKDKKRTLKDNFDIRYHGFGWDDWKQNMSKNNTAYSIPELTKI